MHNTSSKLNSGFKICISGVPGTSDTCAVDAIEIGRTLGRSLANHACVLVTTSTTGFPLWSAIGAQQEGGLTIAFSPAAHAFEHTHVHKLPSDYFSMIVYTGFGTSGAGVLALRSSDAVIFGCGGMTTLFELSTAIQENLPIGILEGDWETDEVIESFIQKYHPQYEPIIRDTDPNRLLDQILKKVKYMRERGQ